MGEENMEFEKKLNRLEEIVNFMEGGKLPLEESLRLFEEGIKLSRLCQTQLNEAEQKVNVLVGLDSNGKPQLENFGETNNTL